MDTLLILKKLEALQKCVGRIESRRPADAATLQADDDLQDILSVNLERAVQMSVDIASHPIADSSQPIPETMSGCFAALEAMGIIEPALALRMQKAVGFRNIAVHEYEEIDWDVVYSIASRNLDDFRAFARRIMEHCGIGSR